MGELIGKYLNESTASDAAKKMGLESLGFGRYGKNGKVTHTVKGDKLAPFEGSEGKEKEPEKKEETKKTLPEKALAAIAANLNKAGKKTDELMNKMIKSKNVKKVVILGAIGGAVAGAIVAGPAGAAIAGAIAAKLGISSGVASSMVGAYGVLQGIKLGGAVGAVSGIVGGSGAWFTGAISVGAVGHALKKIASKITGKKNESLLFEEESKGLSDPAIVDYIGNVDDHAVNILKKAMKDGVIDKEGKFDKEKLTKYFIDELGIKDKKDEATGLIGKYLK